MSARDCAVRLDRVDKTYRLYRSRKEAALDQLGLYRLRFWSGAPKWRHFHALRNVSLRIDRGERVALIGRNGAGKTTLLKLVTGNFAPTAGTVQVNGSVQALMQSGIGFHPEFTGLQNVRSAMLYNGLSGRKLEEAVEDVLDFAELGDYIHQPLSTYSLGMAARLQFAAATAIRPDILIVDEVLSAGDGYFSAKCATRMRKLTGGGCTLLLVSHSAQQVLEFCDRAVWMDHGCVRATGGAQEMLDAYAQEAGAFTAPTPTQGHEPGLEPADLAGRPFLKHVIVDAEPVDPSRESEVEETLSDGRRVFRWSGKRGVRIVGLPEIRGMPETGGPLHIEFECCTESAGSFDLTYQVTAFDLAGTPVCRFSSPRDAFSSAAGARRLIRMAVGQLLLGGRDYLLSLAVFDSSALASGRAPAARYDLLSRALHLRMRQTNDTDPPLLHYPAQWSNGITGRISGWQ